MSADRSVRLLAWAALALLPLSHAAAHGVSLHVHAPCGADSIFHRTFLVPWAQTVEKEAGGRIRFHLHPELPAAAPELYRKLRDGDIDVAWTPIAVSGERFGHLAKGLAQLPPPDPAGSLEEPSQALWQYVRTHDLLDREFEDLHVLALHFCNGGQPAAGEEGAVGICVFAMSKGGFRSLSDELKAVVAANSGAETVAWLARAAGACETANQTNK